MSGCECKPDRAQPSRKEKRMDRNLSGKSVQRGTVLVESAMTLLLLFVILLGIIESGRFLHIQQTLTDAAREGARLSVAPISQTSTVATEEEIEAEVERFLDAARINDADIEVERPVVIDTSGVLTEFTRVRVEVPYEILTLSMFSDLQVTLKGEALMRNETSP
jgi:Flp pilus assembly protein TadG